MAFHAPPSYAPGTVSAGYAVVLSGWGSLRSSSQSLRETPDWDNPSAYFLSLSINAPHIDPEPEPHINKQIKKVRTFARLQNDLQPILPSELGFHNGLGMSKKRVTTQPSAPRMQSNSGKMAGCVVAVNHNHLKHMIARSLESTPRKTVLVLEPSSCTSYTVQ